MVECAAVPRNAIAQDHVAGVAPGAGVDDERHAVEPRHQRELIVVRVAADALLPVRARAQLELPALAAQDVYAARRERRRGWQRRRRQPGPHAARVDAAEPERLFAERHAGRAQLRIAEQRRADGQQIRVLARRTRHDREQARVVAVAERRLAAVGPDVVAQIDQHAVQRLADGRRAVGGARPQVRGQHQLEREAVIRRRRLEVRAVAADLARRFGAQAARGERLPAARLRRAVERQAERPQADPVAEQVVGRHDAAILEVRGEEARRRRRGARRAARRTRARTRRRRRRARRRRASAARASPARAATRSGCRDRSGCRRGSCRWSRRSRRARARRARDRRARPRRARRGGRRAPAPSSPWDRRLRGRGRRLRKRRPVNGSRSQSMRAPTTRGAPNTSISWRRMAAARARKRATASGKSTRYDSATRRGGKILSARAPARRRRRAPPRRRRVAARAARDSLSPTRRATTRNRSAGSATRSRLRA